jgi:hypothetical protein
VAVPSGSDELNLDILKAYLLLFDHARSKPNGIASISHFVALIAVELSRAINVSGGLLIDNYFQLLVSIKISLIKGTD